MYVGAFGATEPTLGDWATPIDTAIWVPAGATSGGVKISASIDSKTIEVDQVMEARAAGATAEQIKALVKRLMAQRTKRLAELLAA